MKLQGAILDEIFREGGGWHANESDAPQHELNTYDNLSEEDLNNIHMTDVKKIGDMRAKWSGHDDQEMDDDENLYSDFNNFMQTGNITKQEKSRMKKQDIQTQDQDSNEDLLKQTAEHKEEQTEDEDESIAKIIKERFTMQIKNGSLIDLLLILILGILLILILYQTAQLKL